MPRLVNLYLHNLLEIETYGCIYYLGYICYCL